MSSSGPYNQATPRLREQNGERAQRREHNGESKTEGAQRREHNGEATAERAKRRAQNGERKPREQNGESTTERAKRREQNGESEKDNVERGCVCCTVATLCQTARKCPALQHPRNPDIVCAYQHRSRAGHCDGTVRRSWQQRRLWRVWDGGMFLKHCLHRSKLVDAAMVTMLCKCARCAMPFITRVTAATQRVTVSHNGEKLCNERKCIFLGKRLEI